MRGKRKMVGKGHYTIAAFFIFLLDLFGSEFTIGNGGVAMKVCFIPVAFF
jgi:hypothetical protein